MKDVVADADPLVYSKYRVGLSGEQSSLNAAADD